MKLARRIKCSDEYESFEHVLNGIEYDDENFKVIRYFFDIEEKNIKEISQHGEMMAKLAKTTTLKLFKSYIDIIWNENETSFQICYKKLIKKYSNNIVKLQILIKYIKTFGFEHSVCNKAYHDMQQEALSEKHYDLFGDLVMHGHDTTEYDLDHADLKTKLNQCGHVTKLQIFENTIPLFKLFSKLIDNDMISAITIIIDEILKFGNIQLLIILKKLLQNYNHNVNSITLMLKDDYSHIDKYDKMLTFSNEAMVLHKNKCCNNHIINYKICFNIINNIVFNGTYYKKFNKLTLVEKDLFAIMMTNIVTSENRFDNYLINVLSDTLQNDDMKLVYSNIIIKLVSVKNYKYSDIIIELLDKHTFDKKFLSTMAFVAIKYGSTSMFKILVHKGCTTILLIKNSCQQWRLLPLNMVAQVCSKF
jgi:hypothetical protein